MPARRHSLEIGRAADAVLLALLIGYWLTFVVRLAVVVDGHRYFSLLDDQMISMRYARHIAIGAGPVWNVGEPPVQGFTNPLWTLVMAAVHLASIPAPYASLVVQAICIGLLAATLWAGLGLLNALVGHDAHPLASASFLLLAGTYAPILSWVLQGSEVGLIALLLVLSVSRAVRAVRAGRVTVAPHVIAAVASLVRMDAALPALAISAWMAYEQPEERRRHLLLMTTWAGGALSAQMLTSLWFFGAPLPNTYYLKLSGFPIGPRIARGGLVFFDALPAMALVLVTAAIGCRLRAARVLALVFTACAAYSVYVGGDAWEGWGGTNRYLTPAMPLVFALAAFATHQLLDGGAARRLAASALVVAMFLTVNGFDGGRGFRVIAFRERPLGATESRSTIPLGVAIATCTSVQSRIAVDWAGAIPYFADRPTVDLLAKSDPIVAREPMHDSPGLPVRTRFWPGHLKWDFDKSILGARPAIVVVLTEGFPERARPFLSGYTIVGHIGGGLVAVRDDRSMQGAASCLGARMAQGG